MNRFFKHLFFGKRDIYRLLPKKSMYSIKECIKESERQHRAEICFSVEASLPPLRVLKGVSSRDRAIEVFSNLRIWDTEDNSGVLLYLLLADRNIQIVADRGINKLVRPDEWNNICEKMKISFRSGNFEEGVVKGIIDITLLLKKHFPSSGKSRNEISDVPIIL